jgi:hypothetical protein
MRAWRQTNDYNSLTVACSVPQATLCLAAAVKGVSVPWMPPLAKSCGASMVASGAMSFELGGKQPIAVSAGGALIVFALPE